MKLGTRITLSTASLVVVALSVYGYASVRIRRIELSSDLERETQSLGNALQVAMEAAATAGRRMRVATELERQSESVGSALPAALREALEAEDLRSLVARVRGAEQSLRIDYLELPAVGRDGNPVKVDAGGAPAEEEDDEPPPKDPTREARLRRVRITGAPWGEHVERDGAPIYAYVVPIRDEQQNVVAAIDLVRDESVAERELVETQRNVTITVVLIGAVLALLVWLTTRSGISHPLKRLVVGIDEVSHGDLTRVILRERDDEIGDLAERFNQMTSNLRDARVETQRGVEAKLALEARLRHSEKLATIGQLAAGIAHEVGTPLNVIGGRARALEKKAIANRERGAASGGEPEPGIDRRASAASEGAAPQAVPRTPPMIDAADVEKNASIIAAQAARITKIIQQLLDYARKKVAERGPVDLIPVIRDSIDFLEHQLGASAITARVSPYRRDDGDAGAPEGPVVMGDADQLQQVCLNLCINAIQAMTRGGKLDISIRGRSRRKPGLDVAPPGRYVVLEVADSGVGIPPEDRERIFEPFYSTKQDGGGTGLGLAVSQGIVKDHDGWIEIEGRPEGGTVFRVFLPAVDERPEKARDDSGSFATVQHPEKPIIDG